MSVELQNALHFGQVDSDELLTVLSTQFRGSQMTPGANFVEVTTEGPNSGVALKLTYRKEDLVDIDPGPALTPEMLDALVGEVDASILAEGESSLIRQIWFSSGMKVEGWWRYKDVFQVLPAPQDAPRAEVMLADHPFVVEMRYEQSSNSQVSLVRRRKLERQVALLLNLLFRPSISRVSERAEHRWVLTGPDFETSWGQDGYFFPGFQVIATEFTEPDCEPMPFLPDDQYYARFGIGGDDVVDMPESIEGLLDASFELPDEERQRVLRAAYWLAHSDRVWSASHTAYYLAVITAIEAMLVPESVDLCEKCGKDRSKGSTALFDEFLERYASAPGVGPKQRKELYRVRSKIAHGRALLMSDLPGPWAVLHPKETGELDDARLARRLAQIAIVNWLGARASGGPAPKSRE